MATFLIWNLEKIHKITGNYLYSMSISPAKTTHTHAIGSQWANIQITQLFADEARKTLNTSNQLHTGIHFAGIIVNTGTS